MTNAPQHPEGIWDQMFTGGIRALSRASRAPERPKGEISLGGLIAAAHASCFAMALAVVLNENRVRPERQAVTGACEPHRITTGELAAARKTSSRPGDAAPPAGSSSPWPHSREEAEVERIVHALRGYGVLSRAGLADVCGAAHWSDSGFARALARAVSTGRIKRLGDDLYETTEPSGR
jgi:hypothetical protein